MDPALSQTLPLFAPAPDIVAEFQVEETWPTGYWGQVTVTARGGAGAADWSVRLFLPPGWRITESWGARVTPDAGSPANPADPAAGGRAAFVARPDETTPDRLPAGAEASFGFAVAAPGGDAEGAPPLEQNLSLLAPLPQALAAAPRGPFEPETIGFNMGSWWQGTFATEDARAALANLAATGGNAVALVVTQYVADVSSAEIFRNQQTESDDALRAMIREARRLGLTVMVKPHVHLADFGPHQNIAPPDTETFFAEFTRVMVHYATLAAQEGAELFVLGGELSGMTRPRHRDSWLSVIRAVRAVFPGALTYAANWGEELQVPFWDALDFVGIDLYPPVAITNDPDVTGVVAAWTGPPPHPVAQETWNGLPITEALFRLSRHLGKKIIFTEIGYRSIDGAGRNPADFRMEGARDDAEQAVLYQALVAALAQAPADWLAGIFFWQWPTEPVRDGQAVPDPEGFSPAGKPAQTVIEDWIATVEQSKESP